MIKMERRYPEWNGSFSVTMPFEEALKRRAVAEYAEGVIFNSDLVVVGYNKDGIPLVVGTTVAESPKTLLDFNKLMGIGVKKKGNIAKSNL